MQLTKYETIFLHQASMIPDGIFDFENYDEDNFKLRYGLTKAEAMKAAKTLAVKTAFEMKGKGIKLPDPSMSEMQ